MHSSIRNANFFSEGGPPSQLRRVQQLARQHWPLTILLHPTLDGQTVLPVPERPRPRRRHRTPGPRPHAKHSVGSQSRRQPQCGPRTTPCAPKSRPPRTTPTARPPQPPDERWWRPDTITPASSTRQPTVRSTRSPPACVSPARKAIPTPPTLERPPTPQPQQQKPRTTRPAPLPQQQLQQMPWTSSEGQGRRCPRRCRRSSRSAGQLPRPQPRRPRSTLPAQWPRRTTHGSLPPCTPTIANDRRSEARGGRRALRPSQEGGVRLARSRTSLAAASLPQARAAGGMGGQRAQQGDPGWQGRSGALTSAPSKSSTPHPAPRAPPHMWAHTGQVTTPLPGQGRGRAPALPLPWPARPDSVTTAQSALAVRTHT